MTAAVAVLGQYETDLAALHAFAHYVFSDSLYVVLSALFDFGCALPVLLTTPVDASNV